MSFRSFLYVFLLGVLPVFAQEAAPVEESRDTTFKVATIDIQKLFKGYRKTLIAEREIDQLRVEIQQKSQSTIKGHQALRKTLKEHIFRFQEGTNSLASSIEEKERFQRECLVKKKQIEAAEERERQESQLANANLNKQMARRMNGILKELAELTAKKAESAGFDLVIDISGGNTNQVPPMLFSKDVVDMTPLMEKELSKNQKSQR